MEGPKKGSSPLLFTPEFLLRFTEHPNEDVRFWVFDRLVHFFPADGIEAFRRCLQDKKGYGATMALRGIEKLGDKDSVPILREFYLNESGVQAGAAIEALAKLAPEETVGLVKKKWASHKADERERENTYTALALAKSVKSFELLGSILEREQDYELRLLGLEQILMHGSFQEYVAFLGRLAEEPLPAAGKQDRSGKDKHGRVQDFGALLWDLALQLSQYPGTPGEFATELQGKKSDRVVKWLEIVDEIRPEYREMQQQIGRPEIPADRFELEVMRFVYFLRLDSRFGQNDKKDEDVEWPEELRGDWPPFMILEAVIETLQSKSDLSAKARGPLRLLATHAWCSLMVGLSPYDLPVPESPENCLNFLTRTPYHLPEDYEKTLTDKITGNLSHDVILKACRDAIEDDPEGKGAFYAARLAGRIPGLDAVRVLTEAMDPYVDELEDNEAMKFLAERFEEAIPVFDEILVSREDKRALGVYRLFEDVPRQPAVDLLVKHFDNLWLGVRDEFMEVLDILASKEFIPLLRKEYREGEGRIARVLRLLSDIHEVQDPDRPKWDREIERVEREVREMRIVDDKELFLQLRCQKCGKSYTYAVRDVLVPSNDRSPEFLCMIEDDILCKNCGVRNFYDFTEKARMAVMGHVALLAGLSEQNRKRALLDGPMRWVTSAAVDGKEQTLEEALKDYALKLDTNPNDPPLLIGYANVLKKLRRRDEAAEWFAKALSNEPNAVEALYELGQYHRDLKDSEKAMKYFVQARERLGNARFFRTRNPDALPIALAREIATLQGVPFSMPGPGTILAPASRKVGRNDPCPCGSGRKYKKCCLDKNAAGFAPASYAAGEPPARRASSDDTPFYHGGEAERNIEKRLAAYADTFVTHEEFKRLAKEVAGPEPTNMPPESNPLPAWIRDLLYYGFRNQGRGGLTLIEAFKKEKGNMLSPTEAEILEGRLKTRLGFFQVLEVRPGEGMEVEEILLGDRFRIRDRRCSGMVVKWDILHARIAPMKDFWVFVTAGHNLPAQARPILEEGFRAVFAAAKGRRPDISEAAFIQEEPVKLLRIAESYWKGRSRDLGDVHTPEGDAVAIGRAEYTCDDPGSLLDLLAADPDAVFDERPPHRGGKESRTFTFLLPPGEGLELPAEGRGRGMSVTPHVLDGAGGRRSISGTVTVKGRSVRVESFSVARLNALKKRVEEKAGGRLRFISDAIEPARAIAERVFAQGRSERPREETGSREQVLVEGVLLQHYSKWIDMPIPALGNVTPREAVKSPDGKERVEQLIREIENAQLHERRRGGAAFDPGILRQWLGIG